MCCFAITTGKSPSKYILQAVNVLVFTRLRFVQALHQAAVATLHGTHQSHAELLVSKAHEHWSQVVEELKTQHQVRHSPLHVLRTTLQLERGFSFFHSQSALALAELHKGFALQAAYEDREAERAQLLEHAKILAEKSGTTNRC